MNSLISEMKRKKNFLKKENIYYVIVIISIFFFDRLTKLKIISDFNESTYYINNYINLDLVWNTGVGFGLLSSTSNFFYHTITVVVGLIIFVLLYFTLVSRKIEKIIFSIITGGALGNFYDRISFNAMPDFIDLHYKSIHWFTFNIADIFITIGLIALIIYGSPKEDNEKN